MSVQDNVDLVKKGYAAFGRGDIEALLGLFAEDIEWTVPATPGAPFGGTMKGREAVGSFFKSLAEAEDFQEFTEEDYIAQDDRVVVKGRSKAVVRATGRTLALEWVHLFTVKGGKVQKFVEFFDTAAASDAYRQGTGRGA
jgi:uncharacterized protein